MDSTATESSIFLYVKRGFYEASGIVFGTFICYWFDSFLEKTRGYRGWNRQAIIGSSVRIEDLDHKYISRRLFLLNSYRF